MAYGTNSASARVSATLAKVFGWMSAGLGITGMTAYGIATSPEALAYLQSGFLFFGVMLLQLGLVIGISWGLRSNMSASTAALMFLMYSVATGVTLSVIFLVYQMPSIVGVFFIAVGMFLAMALYGYITRADLTSMGSLLIMVLFGLIIASLVNLYFRNQMFELITSMIGVVVFAGLTAFDMQRIKLLVSNYLGDGETTDKIAIIGALTLYLDFINLFLNLLTMMGKRRD